MESSDIIRLLLEALLIPLLLGGAALLSKLNATLAELRSTVQSLQSSIQEQKASVGELYAQTRDLDRRVTRLEPRHREA
jgi:peptidoglycan hydrolase CwlO-like protein